MLAKIEKLNKARELRKQGKSVNNIAKELGVSKGSVSTWVRDVQLTEKQIFDLLSNSEKGHIKGSYLAGKINKEKYKQLRREYQQEGRELAKQKDPDFFAGCMLYWGEGSKSISCCRLTNSDVNLLKYYISFLRKFFAVKDEDIRIGCQYYTCSGLTNKEVETYWIEKLNLPASCFLSTSVNHLNRKSGIKRQEKTKYGVVKVTINDVRILQIIYGGIQEICGFNNDEWLG